MSAAPFRLLIADDEAMNKNILARRLKREGYETMDVSDGEEAVQKIRSLEVKDRFIVILMDINMPIMDGIEATRIIKNEFAHLPVIAVTACVVDNFDYKGFGFSHLCRKPVNFAELLVMIQACKGDLATTLESHRDALCTSECPS